MNEKEGNDRKKKKEKEMNIGFLQIPKLGYERKSQHLGNTTRAF